LHLNISIIGFEIIFISFQVYILNILE